jgi:hypothetical protein
MLARYWLKGECLEKSNLVYVNMKTLLTGIAAAAMLVGIQSANAIPTLTVADNNGHSDSTSDASGFVSYKNLAFGNWDINIDSGIGGPPANFRNGSATQPAMDLGGQNQFQQTTSGALVGNVLTLTFTDDNLGPLNGDLAHLVTGFSHSGLSAVFHVLVNDVIVTTITGFSGLENVGVIAGSGSTVALQAVLTATNSTAFTSFDTDLSVPDAGATWAMLGCGLVGLAFFRRSRKTA